MGRVQVAVWCSNSRATTEILHYRLDLRIQKDKVINDSDVKLPDNSIINVYWIFWSNGCG
ncbi:hypothetical protein GP2143_16716 [marine gamma proteobacterium HTCC2143]|uniref:Uncharacterized protein n=1 Tax=marine gamma proteobacterium HTCC2143 TaxID=247633 RepID=A0Y9W3_9GAMM|nr:hypothetical protein GP2143_16716 [marine gamma proteobacterium HTCC2143]